MFKFLRIPNHTIAMAVLMGSTPGFAIAATAPHPPSTICVDDAYCASEPADSGSSSGVKWHPGHYMQMGRGSAEQSQSLRFGRYDSIARNTAVKGVVVGFRWAQLEGNQGDYTGGVALIRAELNKLKGLPEPKRLVVRIIDHYYGNAGGGYSYFPAYMQNSNYLANMDNGTGTRLWDPAVANRYISLIRAYGSAFDSDPYFEGIVLVREHTVSAGKYLNNSSYSDSAYTTQLLRYYDAALAAFPTTNVIGFHNWYQSQNQQNALLAQLVEKGAAIGNVDTCPDCNMWADRTIRGASGGIDYRGRAPIMYSVEASEMGLNSVGPDGGYTPAQLYKWANETQGASHMFWDYNDYAGSSAQKWATGILPFINANPTFLRDDCPYDDGCNTR